MNPMSVNKGMITVTIFAALVMIVTACGQQSGSGGTESPADAGPAEPSEDQDEAIGPCPGVDEADRAKVVAQVGDVEITVCDVTEALNKMSPYLRKAYESPQKRQQFIDNMIRFELIAQEAERRGYSTDEEVERVRKQMMIQRLNKEIQDSVRLSDITEEELRAYYDENERDYHKAEMVRIARILCKTQADAEKVLNLAKSKANDSRYFRQLARDHSIDDETKEHGGDLPYFPRGDDRREGDPELEQSIVDAAFELDMRDPLHAKVIKTADGYNVIRLRGRRKARDLSFDDVKRQIRHRLHRDRLSEAREELVTKLRKNSDIQVFEDELAKVRIDMPRKAPGKANAKQPVPVPGPRPAAKQPAKAGQ